MAAITFTRAAAAERRLDERDAERVAMQLRHSGAYDSIRKEDSR